MKNKKNFPKLFSGFCLRCRKKRYIINAIIIRGEVLGFCSNCCFDIYEKLKIRKNDNKQKQTTKE